MKLLVLTAIAAIAALGAPAWAQSKKYPPEPVDADEEQAKKSNLWDKATNPNRKPYEDLLAEAQTALDDRSPDSAKDAAFKLSDAIRLLPDDPRAYRMRGDAHTTMKDWARCATDYGDAIQRTRRVDADPKTVNEMRKKLGLCQARAGKLADAEKTLGEAAASGNATGEMWMRLGEVRIAMGKLDEAIAALESAADHTDISLPLVRWLLMGAYDRARKPALAAEVGRWAIEGRQEDGGRRANDREMTQLRNPAMPLLGNGESEYLQGLASNYFDPPRPEYALLYFRRFLQVAPDSPWRKRAEEHLRDLKNAELPEYVDKRGGSAPLENTVARPIVRKMMPQMRQCLAKQPGMIIEITITKSGPRSTGGQVPTRRGIPPDGVTSLLKENLDGASKVDSDNAIRCLEPLAEKLKGLLPPIKDKDTWYRATFNVVAP